MKSKIIYIYICVLVLNVSSLLNLLGEHLFKCASQCHNRTFNNKSINIFLFYGIREKSFGIHLPHVFIKEVCISLGETLKVGGGQMIQKSECVCVK